ncbi:hypothetical protein HCX49_05705 [Sphingobacterium kitahiroshimense]|uniref:hypothetical protein n=1 Tax=Sphingobacterium sp. B16(2022) TaxID=2914044 RepID=UPI001438DD69|nr:hypothetical protein [Sphingobacterium sp. B16(2022)]NJI72694.1 hypothetical protein [Sphingobacterium sp. B16(2022)]
MITAIDTPVLLNQIKHIQVESVGGDIDGSVIKLDDRAPYRYLYHGQCDSRVYSHIPIDLICTLAIQSNE